MKWIIGLVVVAVLGWFGFQYMNKNSSIEVPGVAADAMKQAQDTAAAVSDDAMAAAQDAMPAGMDLGNITGNLDGVLSSTSDALTGITDVESAQAALPALEDASGKLRGLSDTIGRLPDAAKGPIAGIIRGGITALDPIIEKVTAIPGVGPLVEPVINPMLAMMEGLAG